MTEPRQVAIAPRTLLFTALIVVAGYALWVLRDVVLVVLTSIVLASAVSPAVGWLEQRRVPRVVGVVLMYAVFFGLLGFAGLYLFPLLLYDFASLIARVPHDLAVGGSFSAPTSVLAPLSDIVQRLPTNAVEFLAVAFGGLMSFVLIVVLSFYFAVEERGVRDFLSLVVPPLWRETVLQLWQRSQRKMGQWLQGQLLLVVLVGTFTYLLLAIFQVPHALALASLAGILEIIPIFGPILAAIPAVGLAYMEGGPVLALTIAGGYLLIQQFENHLIYPLVVTKVVGVPPVLVILALVVGAKLGGFLGVILAVPLAAVAQEVVGMVRRRAA